MQRVVQQQENFIEIGWIRWGHMKAKKTEKLLVQNSQYFQRSQFSADNKISVSTNLNILRYVCERKYLQSDLFWQLQQRSVKVSILAQVEVCSLGCFICVISTRRLALLVIHLRAWYHCIHLSSISFEKGEIIANLQLSWNVCIFIWFDVKIARKAYNLGSQVERQSWQWPPRSRHLRVSRNSTARRSFGREREETWRNL